MKLIDVRKLSIRDQVKIRFGLRNGMDCVITEHGVAQVPGWKGIPDFSLEDEFAAAEQFTLEPAVVDKKTPAKPQSLRRSELEAMAMARAASTSAQVEHDDE